MNYYIDTEFQESGPGKPIKLISIGIVSSDGREFYAESSEYSWDDCDNPWLVDNVKPHLKYVGKANSRPGSAYYASMSINKIHMAGAHDEIRRMLQWFLSKDPNPVFYAYFADYDWVVFCQIFGRMTDLPPNFPMYCRDLKQTMDELHLTKEWKTRMCPDPEGEHNALVDARWNRDLHDAMHKTRAL